MRHGAGCLGYLDISCTMGSGMEIAEKIRKATKDELGLTVSRGIAYEIVARAVNLC